jgi:hypothetical protein
MNKFESFSIGHHLSDYPEDWSYKQILDELKRGDDELVTPWFVYEELPLNDLAGFIQEMTDNLQRSFT